MKASQTVLVIYEEDSTRNLAVQFIDELVGRYWSQCDFEVEWCSFSALAETRGGRAALHKACEADLIVFCAEPYGPLPIAVELWVGSWAAHRGQREGTLIGLLDPSREGSETASRYTWLRSMAHKAGMDYLTGIPQHLRGESGCADSCLKRAAARTSLLDEILSRPHQPIGR